MRANDLKKNYVPEQKVTADNFVILLMRHEARIKAFVSPLVGFDTDIADEVLQTTSIVAWEKFEKFRYIGEDPDEEIVRWICTIARFTVLGFFRDRKRRRSCPLDENVVNELADMQEEEPGYFESRRLALRSCLKRLAPSQIEAIQLRYDQGLSMSEIADRQGHNVNAATVAMCRIRRRLENCIRHTLSEGGSCGL